MAGRQEAHGPPHHLFSFPLPPLPHIARSSLSSSRSNGARAHHPYFLRPPPLHPHPHRIRLPAPPPPASFRLSEILGGRGLCNGEVGIRKELLSPTPPPPSPSTPSADSSESDDADPPAVDTEAFEKEMMGLTGGFPGGEVGLKDFVAKNPPPPPPKTTQKASSSVAPKAERPRPPKLPLFLPGMVVLVKNPNNAYHMYCGIVQRVTDGKVGVLFEGGNWDRLITFGVDELEGREKGPPMVNPKSVVLEALVEAMDEDKVAEEKKEEEGKAAVEA